jgi:hypothetical protein
MSGVLIKKLNLKDNYRYLWLKYVTGVNTTHHCAKGLIGEYSKRIHKDIKGYVNEPLDEQEGKVYYLCGVTTPYRHQDNLHVAFKLKEGSSFILQNDKLDIYVENAEVVTFGEYSIDQNHPKANVKEFNTCRNWQFAHEWERLANIQKIGDK